MWRQDTDLNVNTQDALIACLPPQAYERNAPGVRAEAWSAAAVLDASIDSADVLLVEHQPDRTGLLLGDWERNYSLPDACIGGADASPDARRLNLLARIRGRGDLSRQHMLDLALSLGYPNCTITEFGGMTCMDPCDSPVNGEEFIGVWRLNVPVSTAIVEATCESPCDVQLRRWGNTQLECVMVRHKPAHTVLLFGYAP